MAHSHARTTIGEAAIFRRLSVWWCEHYNRPLKDPILQSYTLEDLIYEFYLFKEHKIHQKELDNDAADKIEEEKLKLDEAWADMMEAEDSEDNEKAPPKEKPYDPLADPKNIEWMEQQLEEAKLFFDDETIGEDIVMTFDDTNKD